MIICENILCIYQKNGFCLLDETSINSIGQCMECINVTINADELEAIKEKQRNNLAKEYEKSPT